MELIAQYPASTLVCLTVIMPGNVKRNFHSLIVAQAGMTAMVNAFSDHILHLEARDLVTGYEAYLITSMTQREDKQLAPFQVEPFAHHPVLYQESHHFLVDW